MYLLIQYDNKETSVETISSTFYVLYTVKCFAPTDGKDDLLCSSQGTQAA